MLQKERKCYISELWKMLTNIMNTTLYKLYKALIIAFEKFIKAKCVLNISTKLVAFRIK